MERARSLEKPFCFVSVTPCKSRTGSLSLLLPGPPVNRLNVSMVNVKIEEGRVLSDTSLSRGEALSFPMRSTALVTSVA